MLSVLGKRYNKNSSHNDVPDTWANETTHRNQWNNICTPQDRIHLILMLLHYKTEEPINMSSLLKEFWCSYD